MRCIIPIVEGKGEVEAIPILLRRYLQKCMEEFTIDVGRVRNTLGCHNIETQDQVGRFIQLAQNDPECCGIILVRDADRTCPTELARRLAGYVETACPRVPVAVVCPKTEYEAWFLASLHTIRGRPLADAANATARPGIPPDASFDGDVEAVRSPKGWLSAMLGPHTCYKETTDQAKMTAMLDFDSVLARSRSFQRMCHAIGEIVEAVRSGRVIVSPRQDDAVPAPRGRR